jgi:hypothetical protein
MRQSGASVLRAGRPGPGRSVVLWLAAAGLAAGLAIAPVRAAASDTVSLSATRTLTLLPPSAFGSDDPGDGWVLDGRHHDDGIWLGVVRAQVTKFVADAAVCAPAGYLSLQVVSPSRSSYSLGLVYASKNGDSLLASPLALDAAGSADISSVPSATSGALPQFLVVLGGSGQAPASVDVKLTWTGVADPTCTGVSAPPPTLKVIEHVVGGSAGAGQWSLHVQNAAGSDVVGSPQAGSETGTTYTLSDGSFTVSETGGVPGYTETFSGDCDPTGTVTLAAGDQKTCTLTNTYRDTTPPVLHGPGDLAATASSPAGASVSYDVTASDPDDPAVMPDCVSSPSGLSSGSTFPTGTTGIHCTASDAAGNAAAPLDFTVTVLDAPPVVTVPANIDDGTGDPNGKPETFAVSATDYLDGTLLASCDHAPGSTFPIGATTVLCSATNSSHLTTTASFTVTIRYVDVTPPVLHGPGDLSATATSSEGAVASFQVTAGDPDDAPGVLTIACDHASGATFAIGVTTVACQAHDPAGNEAQRLSFTITVNDAAPALSLPADISDMANGRDGKAEMFAASASDFADGILPVVCDHAPGDTFPIGATTVHCHATNSSGQTTDGSFTVTIAYVDVTPPTIRGPGDLTAIATSSNGASVSFVVSATDPDDEAPTVVCDHASGATFAIGVTTVTCHAHDPAGNEAQPVGFTVTVGDAAPKLSLPDDMHDTTHDPKGLKEAFAASASDFEDGSLAAVCDHGSRDTFPVGATTVRCHATNSSGRTTSGSFTVTIAYVDVTPPVIHTSGDQHVTGTSAAGATVFYTATAADPDDDGAALTLVCGPLQSGATFPVGASTVTCTASDPAGNHATPAAFTVTVDPPPPPPPPATVSVAVSGPALGRVGEDVSFSVVVKSVSGTASTGIAVDAQVPDGATLVSTSGAATCTGQTDVVCQFGTLGAGATAMQTIVLRPKQAGSLSLFATVTGEGAAGSATASTAVLDPGTPPPPPPPPAQPKTFNAISTGTVLVNGVSQPSDTLFLVVSGDHIDLKGQLAITTFAGNSGVFSNVPFTSQRRTSAVGPGGGDSESFTVNATGGGTTMTLEGGDFNVCKTSRRTAAKKPKTVVRQLWGRAKGQFTTRSKYSSATIRGTTWGVQDRCDGSFTTAVDDFVTVVDFTAKKTLTLAPGETYLATPPRTPADVFKPPTQTSSQTAASVRSRGLLWAGHRFRTKAQLSAWLLSKGSSWRVFAAKHPALAKALAARPPRG